jgi:hypothetical protein
MTTEKRFLARGYRSLRELKRHTSTADIALTETEETLRCEKHEMFSYL